MFELLVRKMIERRRRDLRDLTLAIANGTLFSSPFGGGEKAYQQWIAQQQIPVPARSQGDVATSWAMVTASARQMQGLDPEHFGNAINIGKAKNRYLKPDQPPEFAATSLEEFRAMIAGKEKSH